MTATVTLRGWGMIETGVRVTWHKQRVVRHGRNMINLYYCSAFMLLVDDWYSQTLYHCCGRFLGTPKALSCVEATKSGYSPSDLRRRKHLTKFIDVPSTPSTGGGEKSRPDARRKQNSGRPHWEKAESANAQNSGTDLGLG